MLLIILKYWMKKKANQQQQLDQQQQQHLLPPYVVRRATNHNPVDIHFENAKAATRCNIATKTANERIGEQEATIKNANDFKKKDGRTEGEQQPRNKKSQNSSK